MKKGWKIGIIILVSILLILGTLVFGLIHIDRKIDCKGQAFKFSDIKNREKCKEGTYYKTLSERPGCPMCQ